MFVKFLLPALLMLPFALLAQGKSSHAWGDRMLLGLHYGFDEDFVGTRDNQYEVAQFSGARAGLSLTKQLYAGIQARIVRARNFETPAQNFYMAVDSTEHTERVEVKSINCFFQENMPVYRSNRIFKP